MTVRLDGPVAYVLSGGILARTIACSVPQQACVIYPLTGPLYRYLVEPISRWSSALHALYPSVRRLLDFG